MIPHVDDLADMRRTYRADSLAAAELASAWPAQFSAWLAEAEAARVPEPNATVLATAGADGVPTARTVLLKGVDERGFVLYGNLASRKGRDVEANPHASLVFPWIALERQVVVTGAVERVEPAEADAYWASRPHGSRLGALASPQGEILPSRAPLDAARAELAARFPPGSSVPRPDRWGGLRVVPDVVEFWQGRPDRLHDRLRYRREDSGGWIVERLAP